MRIADGNAILERSDSDAEWPLSTVTIGEVQRYHATLANEGAPDAETHAKFNSPIWTMKNEVEFSPRKDFLLINLITCRQSCPKEIMKCGLELSLQMLIKNFRTDLPSLQDGV